MLKDIVEVQVIEDYRLHLWFEDGVEGSVDVARLISFTGVFSLSRTQEYFAQVFVNPELGTIGWPNGADLDPDVLYAEVTGEAIVLALPEVVLAG